jgi:hypothetical protein
MFIHILSSEAEECDNCGSPRSGSTKAEIWRMTKRPIVIYESDRRGFVRTIMHMSMGHRDCSVNLCLGCLRALNRARDKPGVGLQPVTPTA